MYFLDHSFFTGDIFIPNLEESCNRNYEVFKLFSKWEKECLVMTLGQCLADEVIDNMGIVEKEDLKYYQLKDDAPERIKFLIDGRKYKSDDSDVSEFQDLSSCGCGCSSGRCEYHTWDGVVRSQSILVNNEQMTFKESYLAYYVYYMWSFHTLSKTTDVGEQKIKAKNAYPVSNKLKRTAAFNYFWTWIHSCQKGGKIGLYGFIHEHEKLYSNWDGVCFKNINIFDV